MTASADRHPPFTFVQRVAHATPVLWVAMVLWVVVRDFVIEDPRARLVWTAPTVVLLLLMIIAALRHERQLCTACADRTPLDWDRATRRARPLLWLFHRRWLVEWTLVAVVVGSVIWVSGVVARHLNHVFAIVPAAVAQAYLTHRSLVPWCPYCRNDWPDGGDEEPSPEPVPPVPSIGRVPS